MKIAELMSQWFIVPPLTRTRIWFAFLVAVVTDIFQLLLGPFGWTFADEIFDIIAMALIAKAIGFHPLLLPTFLIEFLPGIDMLPTWTACTAAVIMLRRKAPTGPPPVIDIQSEVVKEPPRR